MRIYCLALALLVISIVSGQPQECIVPNASCINNNLPIVSVQPQELPKVDITSRDNSQVASLAKLANIDITSEVYEANNDTKARFGVGKKEPAKQEMYKITVHNSGSVALNNVTVSAVMAEGMKFESNIYYEVNRGRLDVTRDLIEYEDGKKTNLTWKIGILGPEEIKSIILEAYVKPQVDEKKLSVKVRGEAPGRKMISDSKDGAEIRECVYRDINSNQPCEIPSGTCKEDCPDWGEPQ